MLSVNIPVYNIEVVDLVNALHEQVTALAIDFEIRVYDDASDEIFKSLNRSLKNKPNVIYQEMDSNLGRAAIRNRMGAESEYGWLLFIDADSRVINANYLKNYLDNLSENRVLCGGTAYSENKPADPEKFLRWTYGHNREAISAKKRNRSKGFIITSNNFLISASMFRQVHFRNELREYGHEDTLLGYDLYCAGVEIFHVDNALEHTGLESGQAFLRKSCLALENLQKIGEELLDGDRTFYRQVSFLRKFKRITFFVPGSLIGKLFRKYREKMEEQLKGRRPLLLYFDLYKLGYYASIKNR
ncbi:glycosyltransferase family A protein [Draconibacterium sp. IB214405]|uniref:glycosyltransferase family 2 protein n=1 Tax=Draconibacterium sp. IB214405 TaxID=3097352 RepID=UPI002A0FEDE6|nr:glycosyltransferase family A protein [Draconibacterium sp. IB214405]MDX8340085.1 glycosyltransferase family A protein [Draconibacterium sp. IB214405]